MNREDQEIADMIATLRETDPDDRHGVSIERAMKTGRRKVYTRRSVGVLTAMAAVVAVSVASTAIGDQFTSDPQPAARYDRFDVWTQEFDVGSAGGFTPATYETGDMQQVITLRAEKPDGPLRGATATVTVWPAGRPFEHDAFTSPPAPATDARPDLKIYAAMTGDDWLVLPWQWTEGAWGLVRVDMPSKGHDEMRDRAIRIVESVHYGPGRPVTVPFTLNRNFQPYSFSGVISSVDRPGGRRSVALRLAEPRPREQDELWFTLGVRPSGPSGPPNSTIGGKRAVQTAAKLIVLDIGHGYDMVVEAKVAGYHPALDVYAAALQLVANPLDEKNWTNDPIR